MIGKKHCDGSVRRCYYVTDKVKPGRHGSGWDGREGKGEVLVSKCGNPGV